MNDIELEAQIKREGWQLYQTGKTALERASGLLTVIESHFYRNPDAPGFSTYVSHWLWAQQGRYDESVMCILLNQYPPPRHPRIQRGYSDWNSFGDPNYKILTP